MARLTEAEVTLETPPELRPFRAVRQRYALHPPETCDGPCCWKLRPMTDGEVRHMLTKREASRRRNKNNPEALAEFIAKYHGKSRWEKRNIVAWDGEGANDHKERHYYNLLSNSNGNRLYVDRGYTEISTRQVFEFMLADNSRSAINVIFGGSYDVNMILKDLDRTSLEVLWATGRVIWDQYRINWTPRKRFSVAHCTWNGRRMVPDKKDVFVLWDVFGYYQCAFTIACHDWGILDDLRVMAMQEMKFQRSKFTAEKLDDIIAYNDDECQALKTLVTKLFEAMDECDLRLTRYDGAGSIATALLKKHKVFDYAGDQDEYLGVDQYIIPGMWPGYPASVYQSAQQCYAGGRIEAPMVGNYIGPVYKYDLNSAYPWAATMLPSFKGATWSREPTWNHNDNSIVFVEWHIREPQAFYPLWYRESAPGWTGTILYPPYGAGGYYGIEYRNLTEHFEEGISKDYHVLYCLNVYLQDDTKPFDWINGTYLQRRKYKDQGNKAEKVLKLGMNSIYGKLAQQEGYSPATSKGEARYPGTHHLIWAGLITARARHALYSAAMQKPEDVIAFATDAVFTRSPLELDTGKNLGQWSPEEYAGITVVQAGVYWLKHLDGCECSDCEYGIEGGWDTKYRGFDPGVLRREDIVRLWSEHNYQYPARLTRFVGLGTALGRTDGIEQMWRQWCTEERDLTLYPAGKRVVRAWEGTGKKKKSIPFEPHQGLTPTLARGIIGGVPGDCLSMRFPIVWIDGVKGTRYREDGTDYDLLEKEWQDSYE